MATFTIRISKILCGTHIIGVSVMCGTYHLRNYSGNEEGAYYSINNVMFYSSILIGTLFYRPP